MRVLLFTGKGGVGKTTTAAATALRCAEAGLRTLVMSTDPAHSLADSFDIPLSATAELVADNLVSREDYDKTVGDKLEADAAVGSTAAARDTARLNLGFTKVTAPVSGRIRCAKRRGYE